MESKREKLIFLGILAVVVALVAMFVMCAPAQAAPPKKGEMFAAVSARYIQDLGVGAGLGYQWKKSGVLLLGSVTYDQTNATNGTTPYGCVQVPFTVPASGHRGLEFTVAFPLGKKRR